VPERVPIRHTPARDAGWHGVVWWRCGDPIDPGARWDLGHVDEDGRAGGLPERHPEHHACNRATVTILKRKLAEAEAPRGSREW